MRLGVPLVKRPSPSLLRAAAAAALVGAVTVTSAGVASAGVIGPDVSSYNHDNGATLDWRAVQHRGGASFVFIKATEGGGYRNPAFSSDFAAAGSLHLIRGAYHFARPSGVNAAQIATNATAEARQFGHTVGTLAGWGNLPPVLDLEDAGTLSPGQLSLWTLVWLQTARKLTGRTPDPCTRVPSFWKDSMGNSADFASYPLWLANYGVSAPTLVGGWKSYAFWQYSESGRMAGAALNVDLSVFNGSSAQLEAMTVSPAAAAAAAADAAAAAATASANASANAAATNAAAAAATASSAPLRYTTLAGSKSADRTRTDVTARSDVRSWLSVFGMDGSRTIQRF